MKNKVVILTIGDELLIGQTIDTNSAWMGKALNAIGYDVIERITVGDDPNDMNNALNRACDRGDVVLITGGLGPTNDDRTLSVLGQFMEKPLVFHQPSYDKISRAFNRRGIPLTDGHKKECMLPEDCVVLPNSVGSAPGTKHQHQGSVLYSMPGVPSEMKAIMQDHILPELRDSLSGSYILHKTYRTLGIPESTLAERLKTIEDDLPHLLSIAYLPSIGEVKVRLTGKGNDFEKVNQQLQSTGEHIERLLQGDIYGYDDESVEIAIGKKLLRNKLMLGLAESCTGGHISAEIVAHSGSSRFFKGSIVSYSNILKEKLLKVSPATINSHGAVSEATVKEMVNGALTALDVDIAVAVSGIAGPGGGSTEKPVGTIWIAVGDHKNVETILCKGKNDRLHNIKRAHAYAMILLMNFLDKHYA